MLATVIGTIESAKVAQKVIDELLKAGFKDQDVEILEGDEDEIVAEIVERGFDEDDARGYAKAVSKGKTVVAARVDDAKAEKAVAIIERYEASDESTELEEEQAVSEVEEKLSVGKSKVASGGVRVTTHVSEQPIEKTVTLRDEQVEVERKPVNRKLKPEAAASAFEEKTVEMLGTSEEVEVNKEAYVTGEVSLGKRVEEHEEKVRDTVRRSEVEVEKLKPSSAKKR